MAIISGLSGTVAWTTPGATLVQIFRWRMSLVRPVYRYKVFGTLTGDPAIADSYSASGTIDCYMDTTGAIDVTKLAADAASASLVLTSKTSNTYTFNAHLSTIDSAAARDSAPGTVTYGFESDGAITFANG